MTDQGPYREAPKFLLCPRCGELLDRAFDDVLACMRCEGIFITPPTAGLAFGNPAWPPDAAAMWWKSSLQCPICAHAGAATTMAAQSCEGTQIDRCATHGLWLDRGELGRLMGTTSHELEELRRRLHGGEPDLEKLHAKREAWRKDVDARRRAVEERDAAFAAQRQRQIAQAEDRQREERAAVERDRRYREMLERPESSAPLGDPQGVASTWREAELQHAERTRVRATERQRVEDRRVFVVRAIGELETQLGDLRMMVREVEAELSVQRAKLRVLIADLDKL